MKFLNIILFYVYINSASSQLFEDGNKRIVVKQFPKKVLPGFFQLNYSGKYIKPKYAPSQSQSHSNVDPQRDFYEIPNSANKALTELKPYTAFIPINKPYSSLAQNVPESLFFPHNPPSDNKPRVKKVLPDHVWTSLRKKRSADDAKNVEPQKSATTEKKGEKNVEKKGQKKADKKAETKRVKKLRKGRVTPSHPKVKSKAGGNHTRPKKLRKLRKGRGKGKGKRRHIKKSSSNDSRRLISGRDGLIEQYPYVISIQKDNEHWCAGAILNPRLIITTANCLWKSSAISRLKVRAGSRYTNQGGQTFKIQEVMKHPGWKIRKNPDFDVALALLDKNIRFSHSVHGVDLPNIAMMPAFDDAWVTSWGTERRDGIFDAVSSSLQVYHVKLMDRNKCNNITKRFGVSVSQNFICLTQTGRRGPCTRDTGAPAVSDGVLWGLASWGIRKLCGTERYPAMFSYLASPAMVDFITNATHQLMSEERRYPYPDRLPK